LDSDGLGQEIFAARSHLASIDIEEIAHALSMTVQFNGHYTRFYSVAEHAEHSVYVSVASLRRNSCFAVRRP